MTRLQNTFAKIAAEPALQERLGKLGIAVRPHVGPEYGKFLNEQSARCKKVIDDNNVKMEN